MPSINTLINLLIFFIILISLIEISMADPVEDLVTECMSIKFKIAEKQLAGDISDGVMKKLLKKEEQKCSWMNVPADMDGITLGSLEEPFVYSASNPMGVFSCDAHCSNKLYLVGGMSEEALDRSMKRCMEECDADMLAHQHSEL